MTLCSLKMIANILEEPAVSIFRDTSTLRMAAEGSSKYS